MPEVLQQVSEGKRREPSDKCVVETGCGEKAYRGRIWRMMGKELTTCTWDVGILSPRKKGKEVSRGG